MAWAFWTFVVLVVLSWLFSTSTNSIIKNGISARGILLEVGAVRLGVSGTGIGRFEQRKMRIDIEIPGQPPYEVRGTVLVPANMVADALPGATVALRLGKRDRKKIVIVGPGVSFNAASLATQGQPNQGAA